MAEVVGIKGNTTKGNEPVPAVVAALKDLLEKAEAGNVRQLAAVYIDVTGLPIDLYTPGGPPDDLVPVICGLEMCKATLLKQMI